MSEPKGNTIAFLILMMADIMTMGLFFASRTDPSLRIAMLVAATATIAGNLAIASTLMVGKDVTKPDPSDLPPNSSLHTTQTTDIKADSPPIPKA